MLGRCDWLVYAGERQGKSRNWVRAGESYVKTGPVRNGIQLLQRSAQFDFVKHLLLVITYVEKRLDNKSSSQNKKKKKQPGPFLFTLG